VACGCGQGAQLRMVCDGTCGHLAGCGMHWNLGAYGLALCIGSWGHAAGQDARVAGGAQLSGYNRCAWCLVASVHPPTGWHGPWALRKFALNPGPRAAGLELVSPHKNPWAWYTAKGLVKSVCAAPSPAGVSVLMLVGGRGKWHLPATLFLEKSPNMLRNQYEEQLSPVCLQHCINCYFYVASPCRLLSL